MVVGVYLLSCPPPPPRVGSVSCDSNLGAFVRVWSHRKGLEGANTIFFVSLCVCVITATASQAGIASLDLALPLDSPLVQKHTTSSLISGLLWLPAAIPLKHASTSFPELLLSSGCLRMDLLLNPIVYRGSSAPSVIFKASSGCVPVASPSLSWKKESIHRPAPVQNFSLQKKMGATEEDFGGIYGFFLVFIGFLSPPPTWKVFFEARKRFSFGGGRVRFFLLCSDPLPPPSPISLDSFFVGLSPGGLPRPPPFSLPLLSALLCKDIWASACFTVMLSVPTAPCAPPLLMVPLFAPSPPMSTRVLRPPSSSPPRCQESLGLSSSCCGFPCPRRNRKSKRKEKGT